MSRRPTYTITQTLHEGPATVVHRARRDDDGADVALKILRSDLPGPAEAARLRREYALLAGLDIPGIPRVHALEVLGGRLCLVMEALSGRSLEAVLREQRLPLAAALHIGVALAGVLERLHAAGVIHKDIKPQNILVDLDAGTAVLVDLGVAARLGEDTTDDDGVYEGTLAYLAPEQTGRMNRGVDHRADLYAFGVTLYELVTGGLPFATTDPMELLHSHAARAPTPAHTRDPAVPPILSDIIQRLLAKAAEDRYQSAAGLRADLSECLLRLLATGHIEPFPLARHERGRELRLSQRLHGRQAALASLLAGWRRAARGSCELLLLSGPSGVGKSALVDAMRLELDREGAYFIAGKCDQLNHGTPYAPLERAFQALVRRALTEPRDVLEALQARLLTALGPNGRVVADLVPALDLLIGAQPPVPGLGPAESRNRLNLVFQRFLAAFAAPQRPLTLFLDDLQWADPATLKLLTALLTDPAGAPLLVIGACRDAELGDDHPLALALAQLRASGCPVTTLTLAPLVDAEVAALVGDTLDCPPADVAPLAALLREQTGGNPFFIGQLLLGLYRDQLLTFAADRGAWTWDQGAVRLATSGDVLTYVADKLRTLAPATQRVLQFAACVGHRFDRELVAEALAEAPAAVDDALAEARAAGLLVLAEPGARAWRFVHDRIQQAAHAQLSGPDRRALHLRLARLLRARLGPEPHDDELFTCVHHADLGADLITDPDERRDLVQLELAAARRARLGAAFEAAAGYLTAATARMDPASWEHDHAATFAIHAELAECTYLSGRLADAELACQSLLVHARTGAQRMLLAGRRMEMRVSQSRFAEAVDIGLAALDDVGIHIPRSEEARAAALPGKLAAVDTHLGDRRVDQLLDAPTLADPDVEASLQLLMLVCIAGYYTSASTYALAALEQVLLSLAHGNAALSPVAYMAHAFILAALLGQYERAEQFGELALALQRRAPDPRSEAKLHHVFGTFIHFRRPMRDALAHLERAVRAGLETGDFVFLSSAADNAFPYKFALGTPLPELRIDVARSLALVRRTQDALSIAYLSIATRLVAALEGRSDGPLTLTGDGFHEDGTADALVRDGLYPVACWFHVARLVVCHLHGDDPAALAAAADAEALAASTAGQYFPAELSLFACLAAATWIPQDVDELRRRDDLLARHAGRLALWAASCPENYRHKHLLVQAELARLDGRHDDATDGFDQALTAAHAEGFPRDEAIVAERAARYHLERGRPRIARTYLIEAHAGYVRWGARVKAARLVEQHPELLRDAAPLVQGPGAVTLTTRMGSAGLVDAATLVRAAQALVGEVVLERVLAQLVRLVVESAGAQRGVLLLAVDGQLRIAARQDDDHVAVDEPVPLEQAADIAASVVRYVARTREPVVLDDAARDHRFAADPYLVERRPRSLLCLALTRGDRLTGVLYLENNATRGAFTRARVDLAGLLASLAATAVANAQLYARVDEVTRALRGANESLEAEVSRRTLDLRATNDRLEVELRERARAEQARSALHEQVVRMQEAQLDELSTPILPISDRVVVMPLIGTMDARRGRQVMDAALTGVQLHRAEVVILDVTGMKMVDAEVADMLAATAGALRLLGARALVTGVSPEVAWTFVERGEALGAMTTVATLKAAVAQVSATTRHKPRA